MAAADSRRPIAARQLGVIQRVAAALARSSATPNQISLASIVAAAGGAAALLLWPGWPGVLACVLGIQLRLLCNLLDGMVAVEGGKSTPSGALYNEYPDRIADSLLLVAAGHAAGLSWLGWLCALLAALTAYVRLSGGALGLPQSFRGPLAKQQRMAVLCVALLAGLAAPWWTHAAWALPIGLGVIALGSAWTCVVRARDIAHALQQRSPP